MADDQLTSASQTPTFVDPDRERSYQRDGFVVLPFLSVAEVAELRSGYSDHIAQPSDGGLTIDYVRDDRQGMAAVRSLLDPYLLAHLPGIFSGHRPIFRTFVVKHPGPGSEMYLHEDRSWVDERRFRSGTLWIALDDVGPGLNNGGLEVVPKSHRLPTGWSGTNTPDLIRPFEDELRSRLIRPTVPAGSAVYYDSRTVHASDANESDRPRLAAVAGIAPEEASLVHVVGDGDRHALYAVDEEFFIGHHPGMVGATGMPSGYEVIEHVSRQAELSASDLAAVFGPSLGLSDSLAERAAPCPHPPVDRPTGRVRSWLTDRLQPAGRR